MLVTIVFGWCNKTKNDKSTKGKNLGFLTDQLFLSENVKQELLIKHNSLYKILNETDPIKYPELCISYNKNKNDEEQEYFGLKIFDGDIELENKANVCLNPDDMYELSRNLFCLLAENNMIVPYQNGKPMIYIVIEKTQKYIS